MAQRLDTDLGKVVHVTPNGDPAPNNSFIGKTGVLDEIWSMGHRSEERLTIDPAAGASGKWKASRAAVRS